MGSPYNEKRIGRKSERVDETYACNKQDGPYVVEDGIKIMMDDMLQAVRCREETALDTSPSIDLVELYRESPMPRIRT